MFKTSAGESELQMRRTCTQIQEELKIANERIQKDQSNLAGAHAVIKSHSETLGAQRLSFEKYEEAIDKLHNALRDVDVEVDGKNRRLMQLGSSIGNLETQVTMHETERKRLNSEVDHWKGLASKAAEAGGASSPVVVEKLEKIQKEHREYMSS